LSSIGGYSKAVTVSASSNAVINGVQYLYWSFTGCTTSDCTTILTVPSGGTATTTITIWAYSDTPTQSYTVTVTGTDSTGLTHSVSISVTVLQYTISGGGGGGSLAYGTLITMPNGTLRPVQSLKVGDKMLGYDPTTGSYGVSTITSVVIKNATNMLIIKTGTGTPLRVDASMTEVLWTKLSDGTASWLPAPMEHIGYDLWTQNGWVTITRISFAPAGNHTMWDITATMPYYASGYLDPPHPS